jgi:hypothetical protein
VNNSNHSRTFEINVSSDVDFAATSSPCIAVCALLVLSWFTAER